VKIVSFVLIFIAGLASVKGQIFEDPKVAFKLSQESQKPVLMVFSGSDWCAPCIRLYDTVLTNEQFQHYASDHFILLKVDFPQRKKQDQSKRTENEKLADKYNPRGQFPHLVLLRPDQTVLSILNYKNQPAEEFISQLSAYFAE
jgi:thiamine biosynthesis lipoprotein